MTRAAAALLLLAAACGEAEPPAPAACEPFPGEVGCHGAACAACTSSVACLDLEACIAGRCNRCSSDLDCGGDRGCRGGFCLPPLREMELGIAPADLQTLRATPYEEIFVPCTLAVDGSRYDQGCRVRLRGGSSREYPKLSFRITFPEQLPHPGYSRKINLRAEYNDPSFLRNYLGLEIFRRFTRIPAPRVRFVRVNLNGAFYGVMAEVERIGDAFLRRHGRSLTVPLYESDPGLDLFRQGAGSLIPLPSLELYRAAFPADNEGGLAHQDLISLIEEALWVDHHQVGPDEPAVISRTAEAVDLDGITDYLAVMAVIQSQDHVRKNYYLRRENERWELLPWDLDLTFGCLWDEAAMSTLCNQLITDGSPDVGVVTPGAVIDFPAEGHFNLLLHLMHREPARAEAIRCQSCRILASPWWRDQLPRLVAELGASLQAAVEQDPNDRNQTKEDFLRAVGDLLRFIPERAAFLSDRLGC